jgi:hypothetical protein
MGKDSPNKSHPFRFWMVLLVLSILLGTTAILFPPTCPSTLEADNFELPDLLNWIIIYTCAFLIAFCLLILIFKISRRFLRWLFSWRNIKRGLIGFAFLSLIVALFYTEENWRGKRALENYKHEWEAKGEKFDFSSFVPAPVPDEQNFALTPIVATTYEKWLDKNGHRVVPPNTNIVNRLEMAIYDYEVMVDYPTNCGDWANGTKTDLRAFQLYYRALAAKKNEFPVAPQMQSPAADVLLALSKYDAAIEELRKAAVMPYSRFPLDYDSQPPAVIMRPNLEALKCCCQVLPLRAVAQLQNGQSDKALADMKLMLRLIDSIRTEPFLISHLVRIAMLRLALQPVWEGLADHKWSDAQLTELNQELAKLDFLADYEFSMRGERVDSMACIEYLRRTRNFNLFFDGDDSTPRVVQAAYDFIPNSVFYQNELAIARAHQEWLLPVVDVEQHLVSPAATQLALTNIDEERVHWSPNNVIADMLLPGLLAALKKYAYAQSSVDMARVACALERFRLAQGEYPETLDALQPRFIETLPHDVIGGQSLKYHRTDNGTFALYSVGWNGTDDGGEVVLRNPSKVSIDLEKGDWVWRYPISASDSSHN